MQCTARHGFAIQSHFSHYFTASNFLWDKMNASLQIKTSNSEQKQEMDVQKLF